MDEIQIFKNPAFGEVRVLDLDGNIWFVGKDVAETLGYSNPQKALRDHIDAEDRTVNESFTVNGTKAVLINESGLYSLVLKSKLPSAKKFKHWVTSEVLPSIRKHGGYLAGQENMTDEQLLASALLLAQRKIEEKNTEIERMRPKEIFADAVATSHTSILIGDLAKILRQNGVEMGQRRLFEWLRDNGYLIKRKGSDWNMPTQRSMEMSLFEIKETAINNPDGSVRVSKTTKVTGKGQQYFINRFLAKAATY